MKNELIIIYRSSGEDGLKRFAAENQPGISTGFGDPVYDYENFKQGKPERGMEHGRNGLEAIMKLGFTDDLRAGLILKRLEGSGEEVKTIAALFKKNQRHSVIYIREEAREEKAKETVLKNFSYIHFACHGIAADSYQALVLSTIPGAAEDGWLTMPDILDCRYNAELVVLSACETAKGQAEKAEGVTGLLRAVMYAGTPAVIASLWSVNDKSTKETMIKFYENMLEKQMNKDEALRQAKLALLNSSEYSSPLYWSAFVLYGE